MKKHFLFVCVGNTCRSQMAEGFARAIGGDSVEVKSAGTSAAGIVNRSVIEAMREVDIDISSQSSNQLTDELLNWADTIITLGCCPAEDICSEDFGGRKQDWPIDDPLGRPREFMERVRDDIEARVRNLLKESAVERA